MISTHARFFSLSLEMLATASREGYFVDLNPAWTQTLGFTADELRQRPFVDFVHPDDREATVREAARLFAGGTTVRFENRYQAKDGSYRWLAWVARVSEEDGLIFACAHDMTEYRQLLAERDRFKALVDCTTDFIGLAGLDGRATYVNAAGKRLLGAPDLDVNSLTIADCHPVEHAERVGREGIPAASQHGTWTGDGTLLTRDGRLLPISQVIVALKDDKGVIQSFGTIIRDLSVIEHFKKLEQELRNQQEMLREMLRAMSTPIIPISEHIVVMPLIGTMDKHRAEQFLEAALQGAETRRARVIIIDITGLQHIDTSVAGTLINTAAALKLLGAQVVLTGIRAEIARTLIGLGLDFASLTTRSTLQSGITHALSLLGESFESRGQRQPG